MCKMQQRTFFKTRRNIGIDGYSSEIINTLVEDFFIKHITRNGDIQDVWISELLVSIVESEVKIRGKGHFYE